MPTLGAPTLQDILSVSGFHSDAESVRLLLVAPIRLVRALHISDLPERR